MPQKQTLANLALANDTIAKSLHAHLNQWPGKPAQIGSITVDGFNKESPTMMLQQLQGTQVYANYVNGGYMGQWPFAVYMRIKPKDTGARIDASQVLKDLTEYLTDDGAPLPVLLDPTMEAIIIELTATPVAMGGQVDGTIDYQTLFRLRYKQKGR